MKMKSIANYITIIRTLLVLVLLIVEPLSLAFLTIYIICGLGDILDGYIARRTNTTSELGCKLDSIADLLMVMIVIYRLYPVIHLSTGVYYWIVAIIGVRVVSVIVVYVKYRTFGILHTYGNKFTGLLLFISPLLLPFLQLNLIAYILCIVATVSAVEEFTIHLVAKELELDRKSLWFNTD